MRPVRLLAVDPGTTESAWVHYELPVPGGPKVGRVLACAKEPNEFILPKIFELHPHIVVSEMVACYGMPVGEETFETVVFIGQLMERAQSNQIRFDRLKRLPVKMHLCKRANAKDTNIRRALIDKFGPDKAVAIGKKGKEGPLFYVKDDMWAALAVAVTYHETILTTTGTGIALDWTA